MTQKAAGSRYVNAISARLSLSAPQRESLKTLARIAELIPLSKQYDLGALLSGMQTEYPSVEDFERDFPSLCFALATGVGKTRLMGAFISYLHLAKGIRHFFVLAPNLTIYNKLIDDFTPNHPKYVFQGIAEFAQNPPEIITGDNYESGRGMRGSDWLFDSAIHVNLKWFKPAEGHFRIHYSHQYQEYEPDFVVETTIAKYLCEPKAANAMQDDDVQTKAHAAYKWCRHATEHEQQHGGGKPWSYLLIPHDAIKSTMTLQGLAAAYTWKPGG